MPVIDLGSVVGPQGKQGATGPQGKQGIQGPAGTSATINGKTAITITAGHNVELKQEGSSLEISAAAPGQNILDNWYFANPINQRGKTEYTGVTYTIDRWISTNARGTVTLTGAGISVASTSEGASYLAERLEHPLPTGPYTISALVQECEGIGYIQWIYSDGTYGPAEKINGSGLFSFANTVEKEISRVLLQINSNSKIILQAVKLECGLQQTLAHQDADGNWVLNDPPPNKALELMKCQRYFIRLGPMSGSLALVSTPAGVDAYEKLYPSIPIPVTMRANPTPIMNGTIDVANYNTRFLVTSMKFNKRSANMIGLECTAPGAKEGTSYALMCRTSDSYIDLSADL